MHVDTYSRETYTKDIEIGAHVGVGVIALFCLQPTSLIGETGDDLPPISFIFFSPFYTLTVSLIHLPIYIHTQPIPTTTQDEAP